MLFNDPERDVFNATGGWTIVHQTRDDWEVSLIRAAFAHAEVPFKVDTPKDNDEVRPDHYAIAVPVEFEEEALDVLLHVVNVVDRENDGRKRKTSEDEEAASPVIRATPTDVPVRVIASREGLGELVHIEGHGVEIRVGPEPYFIVPEESWEEFTDFSAQRQEFAILLEKEYERLYRWLKAERRFADFLRLVESTYRGSPDEDSPEDFLRAAGWMLAIIVGIAALVGLFRWLESLTIGTAG